MAVRQMLGLLLALTVTVLMSIAVAQERVVVAQGTDAVTLDAHDITDSPSASVSTHMVETLFKLQPDGTIDPWLATDFELSDDGLTLTLQLREGITFHDGTLFDAEAVKFNIERLTDPEEGFAFAFLLDVVDTVEVLGDHSVALHLSDPFAPLLANLTHSSTAMQSPTAIEELGEDYGQNPVGTGPYRFSSWERGQHIDMVRFEEYWGELPPIEEVRFLAVPEGTTRMALVETGEAHVSVRVPPADVDRLQANPDVTVDNTSSVRTIYIYFNHTMEPFTDERVRQAVNYAVNKEDIVDFVLGGEARVSDAPISPGIFGYTPVGSYEYDPERARELLAEAGYEDGFSTTLYSPTGRYNQDIQISEAVQSQLAEVGIDAEIETLEWSAYLSITGEAVEDNVVPMGMLGWGTVTGDADYGLFPLFTTGQHVPDGSNRSFYSNPEVDELLGEARVNPDPEARQELYEQAMQILWDEAAWLYLHSESQVTAIRNDIEGVIVHPTERILVYEAFFR